MSKSRRTVAALFVALLVAAFAMPPVMAQQTQEGLVNVQVGDIKTGDIVSNNNVSVDAAVGVVANVCGTTVTAAVISEQLTRTGSYRCEGKTQFVQITKQKS
jgi:hypothetical protein